MRSKLLLVFSAIALTVMLGVPSAYADQVTLGDTCTTGSLSVSGTVNPSVTGTVSNCFATFEQGVNLYNISPYSITGGTGFSAGSGIDALAGTIDWTTGANLGSGVEVLVGLLNVSSAGTFYNNEYVVGNDYHIDLTLLNGKPSGGEIPVPEPGTLTLLGTGLLTMAGFLRRKLHS
jgi:PEP-CTERM motif